MTTTPISLQDLRRKIYAKAKAEPHWRFWGDLESPELRLGVVEYARSAESPPGRIGLISLGAKQTGERSAGDAHATFDVAGAGNVMMAAGLRATAKAVELPPEPNVGAPVLDPTERTLARPRMAERIGLPGKLVGDVLWRM